MKLPRGMPGPGGVLGECALCGKPFICEILIGETVKTFKVGGCEQELCSHADCFAKFSKRGTMWEDLPDGGPLKKAWLEAKPKTKTPN